MNVSLKPKHQKFIQEQIESGRFSNADAVIETAFELLEKLNEEYVQWVKETRQKVEEAEKELDRGEGLDGETVVNQILERFQKERQEKT
ncbi:MULTISPECIES: type II toxin-antitoxin system ParD family antitoxin [Spirulina sp. CCY15215]|uniref:ribbon-helix-helix domain-containing protein n=1 Tax=Spirulina sp. CCY15215 TaxID=2767591 RepID=UPI0019509F57|nr:type II toxin-antitoxin system ParD family antitoxin [Spirulina major]